MVREDDLRATFSALHAEGAPPGAVSAADLIQRGRAVRSRRRTIAVAGTAIATVGVVALALAVLPGAPAEPVMPGSSVPPTTTTPLVSVTPPSSSHVEAPQSSPPPTVRPDTTAPTGASHPPTSNVVPTPPTAPGSTTLPPPGSSFAVSTYPSMSR